jgi:AraC family transcriptional regulator
MSLTGTQGTRHQAQRSLVISFAGVCSIELLPRAPYETMYTPNDSIIGFGFETQTGTHAFASSRKVAFQAKPNHLSFVPRSCDVYSQSKRGGEYLKIALAHSYAAHMPGDRRFTNIVDIPAMHAAHDLRRALISRSSVGPLVVEYLVGVLIERVVKTLEGQCSEDQGAAWMTPRRLRHIDDMIEDRLDSQLTVNELAAGLGLSAGFFSRAFKAAVGKAPHDYIIDRRVARARELLQSPDLELSEIALAAGFASHAHMTSTFRSRLGLTPSRMRTGNSVTRPKTM